MWVVEQRRALSLAAQPRTRTKRRATRSPSGTARRASRLGERSRLGDQPVRRDDLAHRPRARTRSLEDIPVGLDPRGIAAGVGERVGRAGRVANIQVVRIDPETNDVTAPISVGNAPGALAVSADAVWVVNTLDDTGSRDRPRHERGRWHDPGGGRPLGRSGRARDRVGGERMGTARSRASRPDRRRLVPS